MLPGLAGDLLTGLAVSVLTAGRSYECASLPVPRDWGDPESSGTFDLTLTRVRVDDQEDRIGSLVVNPGGPGARAMVLDGAVDPQRDRVAAAEGQAQGFERAFDRFADWCAGSADCGLVPDARTAVTDAIERARTAPVPGDDGREASAGRILWSVVSALYVREMWPLLADAIVDLDDGDPTGVFTLADLYTGRDADGEYPNMFDAHTAINCADDDTDLHPTQVRDLQEQWREDYPLFGAPLAMGLLDCALWSAERDPYPIGEAEGAPPIVVVGTTGDPATPYESTSNLADLLGSGVVLTWDGEGHTAYPRQDCISDLVDAYLVEVAVPADGTTCTP